MAGQIDVFPTIMGILNFPYINEAFGIDMVKEQRPYIYFSEDDKYGVLDDDFYLIVREDRTSHLYKYKTLDPNDNLSQYPDQAKRMKEYAESMFQTEQWMTGTSSTPLPDRKR